MSTHANVRNLAAWSLAFLTTAASSFTGCSSSSGDDSGANPGDASTSDAAKSDGSVGGDGSITDTCPSDQTKCGSECVSTDRDTLNCGTCGHACAADEVCSSGACGVTCSAGLMLCAGVANVLDAGPSPDAGDAEAGVMTPVDAGLRAPYCASLASDNQNCGACGNVCPGVLACREGSCTHYSGVTGAWQVVASEPDGEGGFTDFSPPGTSSFYASSGGGDFYRYDPSPVDAWTTLTAPDEPFSGDGDYSGPAWVGDAIYAFAPDKVMKYDIAAGTWSAPLTTTIAVQGEGQHTHDDSGHVFAVDSNGNILKYDVSAKTIATVTLSAALTSLDEPRLAWDSTTHLLYAAPSFEGTTLYSIDPATGTVKQLTSVPDTQMSDIFCADRNGHLYANGSSDAAQLYQYDIASDTWILLSNNPPPFSGSNDGACTVTSDGWLYFTDGEDNVAKLQLF
ncbi:MAG: DUF6923 family protein [Polyangiaceae bacterium]